MILSSIPVFKYPVQTIIDNKLIKRLNRQTSKQKLASIKPFKQTPTYVPLMKPLQQQTDNLSIKSLSNRQKRFINSQNTHR